MLASYAGRGYGWARCAHINSCPFGTAYIVAFGNINRCHRQHKWLSALPITYHPLEDERGQKRRAGGALIKIENGHCLMIGGVMDGLRAGWKVDRLVLIF